MSMALVESQSAAPVSADPVGAAPLGAAAESAALPIEPESGLPTSLVAFAQNTEVLNALQAINKAFTQTENVDHKQVLMEQVTLEEQVSMAELWATTHPHPCRKK